MSSLTLEPLQKVRTEDFGQVIEREAFQMDAGVQHFYERARLELGKPCGQNALQLPKHLTGALKQRGDK